MLKHIKDKKRENNIGYKNMQKIINNVKKQQQ